MSVSVNEKKLHCMLGRQWLVETAIDVGITYVMRNRTIGKQFCLWSNGVLCQVLDYIYVFLCQKKHNQADSMDTAYTQLFTYYTHIINEKMKRSRGKTPMFSSDYWIMPYFIKDHFRILFLIRPKYLFQQPPSIDEGPVLLVLDPAIHDVDKRNELILDSILCKRDL